MAFQKKKTPIAVADPQVGKEYSLDDRDPSIKWSVRELNEVDGTDIPECVLLNPKSLAMLTVPATRLRP